MEELKKELNFKGTCKEGYALLKMLPGELFKKEVDKSKIIMPNGRSVDGGIPANDWKEHPYQGIIKFSKIKEVEVGSRVALSVHSPIIPRQEGNKTVSYADQFIYDGEVYYLVNLNDIIFIYDKNN